MSKALENLSTLCLYLPEDVREVIFSYTDEVETNLDEALDAVHCLSQAVVEDLGGEANEPLLDAVTALLARYGR